MRGTSLHLVRNSLGPGLSPPPGNLKPVSLLFLICEVESVTNCMIMRPCK